ncbi:MAG: hypothetical protein U5N53_28275 [Mycobacterium sp.]|nr:hypothetical protein [Mycobacterium sp.]
MAKYTISQIAKALSAGGVAAVGAAITAAGGPDLSSLDLGEWALVAGAGLTTFGATFGTPNAEAEPTAHTAAADVERAAKSVRAVEEQRDIFAQTADDLKGVLVRAGTGLAGDVFEQVLKNAVR